MVLKLPWAQKRMLWAFEKWIFQFFANFWVTKLKPFSGKVRQSIQNYWNQNLIIGSFLENGFEATLSSKTNVVSVWKVHFSVFCKFLSDELNLFSGKARQYCKNSFDKVYFVESILESVFLSLFDHSRQSLLEVLNISNVLNILLFEYSTGASLIFHSHIFPFRFFSVKWKSKDYDVYIIIF